MSFELNRDNFSQIQTTFNQLYAKLAQLEQPEYLKEKIYFKYYQWVLSQLEPIFSKQFDEQTTITALQEFFTNNLSYTTNNLLSPTAIPDSDVMIFLCTLAPLVSTKTS